VKCASGALGFIKGFTDEKPRWRHTLRLARMKPIFTAMIFTPQPEIDLRQLALPLHAVAPQQEDQGSQPLASE